MKEDIVTVSAWLKSHSRKQPQALKPQEIAILNASLADHLTYYKANLGDANALLKVGESKADPTLDPRQLAAWTMLCNQVLNLDEVLNK